MSIPSHRSDSFRIGSGQVLSKSQGPTGEPMSPRARPSSPVARRTTSQVRSVLAVADNGVLGANQFSKKAHTVEGVLEEEERGNNDNGTAASEPAGTNKTARA